MIVGVDLSFIRPDHANGGTESCIKNLIAGWIRNGVIENFVFFIHEDIYEEYVASYPVCKFVRYAYKGSHKTRTTRFQTFLLPVLIDRYNVDVLYYPTYTTGYYRKINVPVVINPHDIQFKFYPEYFSSLKRLYLEMGYSHSLKKAHKIVAISDYVKGTLLQHYKKQCGNKIITIYDPIDFDNDMGIEPKGIQKPYILSVSSIQKHKNMITLVRAFEKIHKQIPHQLVIVGCKGNGMVPIKEYMEEKKLEDRILFTDYIKSEEISWLYSNADLYVTTSLYEGFGMTPIEAMGMEIPTISSRSTSLPEVTMNLANYYEPAEDESVLAEKILTTLANEKTVPDPAVLIERYDKSTIASKMYQLFEELS